MRVVRNTPSAESNDGSAALIGRYRALTRQIDALEARRAAVVVRMRLEGMPVREVADVLGVSPATAHRRMHAEVEVDDT
jgi:DNA-directed RNA polymerase specialized sigma24 family protein